MAKKHFFYQNIKKNCNQKIFGKNGQIYGKNGQIYGKNGQNGQKNFSRTLGCIPPVSNKIII